MKEHERERLLKDNADVTEGLERLTNYVDALEEELKEARDKNIELNDDIDSANRRIEELEAELEAANAK